jgi:gliding motility-associated lipoprotein GldD
MFKKNSAIILLISFAISFVSCKKEAIPKPSSYLRLDYPMAQYSHYENDCHYTFDINSQAIVTEKGDCNFEITYPKMKATIYLSYKPVNSNIKLLLQDAQKLTYQHVIKADDILEQPYINLEKRVFGMFYQVDGNAATNTQFYVTDSTKNFVSGSVYFYAKPNFDSIMPAASYIKNDVQNLMESLKWKK